MAFDKEQLKKFPTAPGVYLMKGRSGVILYVGKAKNLRQRVRQYFLKGGDGRCMLPFLVAKIETIETLVVSSEKEALLLENTLIKKHKPKYNVLLKDDKTQIAIKLSSHPWPKLDIVRYRGKPAGKGTYFGPYAHAFAARKTLDLLHKLFKLRQCSDKEFARRTRPCILYDINKCAGPCVQLCSRDEYAALVGKAVRFLKGQDTEVLKELHEEMQRCAEALEFEKAADILQTIRHIEKTVEKQAVDKPLGADADALGLYREGGEVVVVLMLYRHGKLTGARQFKFANIAQDDQELIETFLLQHYEMQQEIPKEILLPLAFPPGKVLEELLSQELQCKVSILTPQRGEKRAIVEIAQANAASTFKKEVDERDVRERTLLEMQEKFRLNRYPKRMECFDVSNISGDEPVATMVAFTEGKKDGDRYRKYKLQNVTAPNDYGAMYEVLTRRFLRANRENDLPDLLIVDGGKGHLNVALKVLREQNIISVDVIGVAKEGGRHDRGMTQEKVYLPNVKDPVLLKNTSSILFLLQQIRDEAHRSALTFHRKRRSRSVVQSALDQIQGIGPTKRTILLKHFGSLKKIKEASREDLQAVKGISAKDAESISAYFHQG